MVSALIIFIFTFESIIKFKQSFKALNGFYVMIWVVGFLGLINMQNPLSCTFKTLGYCSVYISKQKPYRYRMPSSLSIIYLGWIPWITPYFLLSPLITFSFFSQKCLGWLDKWYNYVNTDIWVEEDPKVVSRAISSAFWYHCDSPFWKSNGKSCVFIARVECVCEFSYLDK